LKSIQVLTSILVKSKSEDSRIWGRFQLSRNICFQGAFSLIVKVKVWIAQITGARGKASLAIWEARKANPKVIEEEKAVRSFAGNAGN